MAGIRDARTPFFNIRILSVSVKNYPYSYPIRSDVVNTAVRILSVSVLLTASPKKFADIFDCSFNTGCQILPPPLPLAFSQMSAHSHYEVLVLCPRGSWQHQGVKTAHVRQKAHVTLLRNSYNNSLYLRTTWRMSNVMVVYCLSPTPFV